MERRRIGPAVDRLGRKRYDLGYRGLQVLNYVEQTIASEGIAPSYAMIANELGIATRGEVAKIVKRLEGRGAIFRVGSERVRRIRLAQ